MSAMRRPPVPPATDVIVAAGFLVASLVQVLVEPIDDLPTSVLIAVGSTVPLAWRRAAPATAALAGTAIWLVPPDDGFLLLGFVIAVLLYFSVGAHVARTGRVVALTAIGATVAVVMTLVGPEPPPVAIGAALAVVGPAVAGRLVARQRALAARLRDLTDELVRERAAAERAAVGAERTRIARELHDVIGHEVTVIALQADAAAAALLVDPVRAVEPVAAVRAAAARALAEMRQAVGLLRGPADDDGELSPQPSLADLPRLVRSARDTGVQVDLVLAPPPGLPPTLQLTAYRVVQEALTNAARHASGSAVEVAVTGTATCLRVEVRDRGGRRAPAAGRGGHGLVGMRERVRMHGGRLESGPTSDGFAVIAELPLVPEPVR